MFLREFEGIPLFAQIETPWVLGRGSLRVLGVLGNSPFSFLGLFLHQWRFYPFWVGEDDGYEIGDKDANERHNWSMKQMSRTLGEGLFLLYGSNFISILQF